MLVAPRRFVRLKVVDDAKSRSHVLAGRLVFEFHPADMFLLDTGVAQNRTGRDIIRGRRKDGDVVVPNDVRVNAGNALSARSVRRLPGAARRCSGEFTTVVCRVRNFVENAQMVGATKRAIATLRALRSQKNSNDVRARRRRFSFVSESPFFRPRPRLSRLADNADEILRVIS